MSIDLNALNLIEKFIVEHGSATIMGVHISYLRDQLSGYDHQVADLKAQIEELKAENKNLTLQLQESATKIKQLQPDALFKFAGVLWKQAGKGFEPTPYCPVCATHPRMFGQPPMGGDPQLWECSKCEFQTDFDGRPK